MYPQWQRPSTLHDFAPTTAPQPRYRALPVSYAQHAGRSPAPFAAASPVRQRTDPFSGCSLDCTPAPSAQPRPCARSHEPSIGGAEATNLWAALLRARRLAPSGRGATLWVTVKAGSKVMAKTVTAAVRISSTDARRQRTEQAVALLAPMGVTSLRGIAAALNERGISTVAGSGRR
jgi:hypothetical protein